MPKINAAAAWDQSTGSTSVIIADIDTGVDRNHPDIANNMWVNTAETPNNGIDDDGNGYVDDYYGWDWVNNDNNPMDDHGHGTHVAGTIAGVGNNGIGVVGVNWTSKIMALKFLSSGGSGSLANGIKALRYAADMGAKISSNSWGCSCNTSAMDDAVKYEHEKGMVMVAAAGNSNRDALDHSPSSADRALSVAASDYLDRKASFSSWGEDIDVAAPGVDVLSLKAAVSPMCTASRTVGTRYCRVSGTSMATPHVAGLAALLWVNNPSLTNEEIRQIIRLGADDLGAVGKDRDFGYGRINANGSMALSGSRHMRPIITTPSSRTTISGTSYNVLGGVAGPRFASYKLEAGKGRSPTSWQQLKNSTTQVSSGVLATINTTSLTDGKYIFRVTATATDGKKYQFQVHDVKVDNVRDTEPPTVNITSPPNGATVSGNVYVRASATDNEGVEKVYFYVDGVLKYIDYSPTYYYRWFTTTVSNGSHNLVAKAYDEAGNIGTSPTVTVNVSNAPPDDTPPSAAITSPSNGSTVSGYVNIAASATDNVAVKYVYLYIDGVFKDTDSSAPYTYYWNSASVSNGNHNIYVIAVDTSLNTAKSPTITVNVSNTVPTPPDNTPPTANITSPSDGSTVSGYVNIVASATDNVAVKYVYFYIDGSWKRTDSSAPYTYYWNSASVSNGNHNIYVRAVDTSNNVGTSPDVTVNVFNTIDTQPPTIPTNLRARIVSSSRVDVAWNASTDNVGVAGYRLYRNGKLIKTTPALGFSDRNVRAGGTYYYRVAAFDAKGNQSDKSKYIRVAIPAGTPTRKLGDLNLDGRINIRDLSILLSRWATTKGVADINRDGRVNIRDLSILLSRWGR
jgi:subtilisin family serine protease